jgi:hypothetical protein
MMMVMLLHIDRRTVHTVFPVPDLVTTKSEHPVGLHGIMLTESVSFH